MSFLMPSLEYLGVEMPIELPFVHRFEQKEASNFGPESFRLDYQLHTFWPVLLNIQLHAEGSEVRLSWNPRDAHCFEHAVDLSRLKELAAHPEVWLPTYTLEMRGTWGLEWWNPPVYRVVDRTYPPPGPFSTLCLSMLRMAGFEFETRISTLQSGERYLTRRELVDGL